MADFIKELMEKDRLPIFFITYFADLFLMTVL